MRLALSRSFLIICVSCSMWLAAAAQDVTRQLNLSVGGSVEIVNRSGRVSVRALPSDNDETVVGKLTASAAKGLSDKEIKVTGGGNHFSIEVVPANSARRIDVVLLLPER